MSPSPTLLGLPIEVLTHICECLCQEHLGSLAAFALASRLCHSVANPLLFHDIHLDAGPDHPGFTRLVQDCHDLLRRNATFQHVRRLFIDDIGIGVVDPESRKVSPLGGTTNQHGSASRNSLRRKDPCFAGDPLSAFDVLDTFFDAQGSKAIHCLLRRPLASDFDTVEDAYTNDDLWRPLALLLQHLRGLRELHFSCSSQFPPCLLQALHRHQPRCKLFINAFRLRSLSSSAPDPHELQLLTSPCLRRIRVACWHRPDQEAGDSGEPPPADADVVRYLQRLAPNLKEVLLDHNSTTHFHRPRNAHQRRPCARWLDNPAPGHPRPPSSLRTLLLAGYSYELLSGDEMDRWKATTDFSTLTLLGLNFRSGVSLAMLKSLATDCHLSSLTTLVLSLGNEQPDYLETAERFFASLPVLSTLHLLNFGSQTTPLLRLGPSLRTLSLRGMTVGAQDISQLGNDCPLLEELAATLSRSMGDEAEVRLYRMLGKCLPRLRRLSLGLDAKMPSETTTPATTTDAGLLLDQFEREHCPGTPYLNGHLRDWLINSAMDETLARAIFDTISSAKDPENSAALASLKIQFLGASAALLRITALRPIVRELTSSWLLVRGVPDAGREDITATKIPSKIKPHPRWVAARSGGDELCGPYLLLERIWPSHGRDWPWEWKSRPLQHCQRDSD